MSNKENVISVFTDPNRTNYENVKNDVNDTKAVLKPTTANKPLNTLGLRDANLTKEFKTTVESKPKPLKNEIIKVYNDIKPEPMTIERVRKTQVSPSQERPTTPVEPIQILHRPQPDLTLQDQPHLQRLTETLETLKRQKAQKERTLSDLRQSILTQQTESNQLDQHLKRLTELDTIKENHKEQSDYFKELIQILTELDQKGLGFKERLEKKEEEIESLLNELSETKYQIQERLEK